MCRVYKPRNDRVADNFIELRKRPGTDPALEPPEATNPVFKMVNVLTREKIQMANKYMKLYSK